MVKHRTRRNKRSSGKTLDSRLVTLYRHSKDVLLFDQLRAGDAGSCKRTNDVQGRNHTNLFMTNQDMQLTALKWTHGLTYTNLYKAHTQQQAKKRSWT